MSNNLYKVEKDLRSIAKRYKSIKYSVGLAILFLMLGTGAFSEEVNNVQTSEVPTREEIASSRENLKNSVGSLQAKIDQAREENSKSLAGLRLELIQLMEQGDQVVKSPWASWQFGANYMYSKWNGTYKGRGDKAEKYPFEGVFTRSNDSFTRYTSPESSNYGLLPVSTNPYSATTSSRSGLGSGYGIASTVPKQEPLTVMNVDASIRPKDVYRDPVAAPTVNVAAPVLQALNVPNLLPPSLDIPTPQAIVAPDKTPNIVINPTVQYNFGGRSITGENPWGASHPAKNQDGLGLNYWSGWNPNTNTVDGSKSVWSRNGGTVVESANRVPNLFYLNAVDRSQVTGIRWTFKNANADVAGNPSWNPKGTSAMHTVWDGDITNVNVRLHGYATFIAAETWHNGNVTINNSTVTIENGYNSVFFGYPGSYYTMGINNNDYHSYNQRGGYSGNLKVNINANNNYIHSVMGVQGSFKLDNSGDYNVKGDGNLAYLGIGYTPNWQNLKGSGDVTNNSATNMTPSIQLGIGTGKINVDGNSNVGLFFENRYSNFQTGGLLPFDTRGTFSADDWRPSVIGIYQGEVAVGMKVGENSASKGNVGVYSRSGQRQGIVPETDLGAPTAAQRTEAAGHAGSQSKGLPDYNIDKIHNLEIAKTEIYFGKHAVDSIMFAADKGSVIDVARPDKADKNLARTAYTEVTPSTEIRDAATNVTSSYDDTANKAATGTVIAYSTGVWNNTGMPGGTAAGLVNKPSEINLYKPVIMTGRAKLDSSNKLNRSVALIGDNKGIVNAKDKVTALGYSSIVALAQNNGVVNVAKDIIAKDGAAAKDAATKPYLYNNIGAYAGANGTVNITGNADIYGIGAMASGSNAVVNLNGTNNIIKTGKAGALVATNGGVVNFGGGTITHSENFSGDHDSSTPFNADSSSHINFKGATTLNISHGVLIPGTKADYAAAPGTTKKYNGMQNVTVNLTGNNVVLASNNGIPKVWDGTPIANLVKSTMKVNAFNTNGHSYKIYYINGTFDIDSNINVGSTSDDFNKVGLSREVVTIKTGRTVSSTVGKG